MVEITERASTELRRLLRENRVTPRQGVRLRVTEAGRLAMSIDVPHRGDVVVRRDDTVLLILADRLSASLAQRVLDVTPAGPTGGRRIAFNVRRRIAEQAQPPSADAPSPPGAARPP
jgi:hypothetical protein